MEAYDVMMTTYCLPIHTHKMVDVHTKGGGALCRRRGIDRDLEVEVDIDIDIDIDIDRSIDRSIDRARGCVRGFRMGFAWVSHVRMMSTHRSM